MHRLNIAERAISTSKDHFIAGICAMDPYLPIQNWYQILRKVEITPNLLCLSRLNPRISTYVQLNGEFYFKHTATAPPGIRNLVQDKAHNRGTWYSHGHNDWYVRPAMLHCRCITSYTPQDCFESSF